MKHGKMTRTISRSSAPVLEDLELEQARLITRPGLARIARARALGPWTLAIARRLKEQGWLLPLKTKGVWEFAPAARAGAFTAGDPYIELRATLLRRPDFPVQLAYDSAAWLLGLMQRPPNRDVISVPFKTIVPVALAAFRIVHRRPKLPTVDHNGLPVWQLESLLVLMAAQPRLFRDWPNVSQWLSDAVSRVDPSKVRVELDSQSRAARIRAAYLLEQGGGGDFARDLMVGVSTSGLTYFGPRKGDLKYDSRYNLYDSLLKS